MFHEHFSDELLLAYQDGELPRRLRSKIQNHLELCWQCRTRIAGLEDQIHELSRLFDESSCPGLDIMQGIKLNLKRRVQEYERHTVPTDSFRLAQAWGPDRLRLPVIVAACLILAIWMVWQYERAPIVLAAPLLARSIAAEQAGANVHRFIVHRSLLVQERSAQANRVTAHREIQIWQGWPTTASGVIKARRVFDENGTLIAGDWSLSAGPRHVYRKGAVPETLIGHLNDPPVVPGNIDAASEVDLSSKEFAALVGDTGKAVVEKAKANHIVIYAASEARSVKPELLRAWLVLDNADLRPIERGFRVRDEKGEREYVLSETRLDRYALNAVSDSVFAPDAELTGATAAAAPVVHAPAAAEPLVIEPPSPVVNARLEIDTIFLLGQANIMLGDRAALTRQPDGSLLASVRVSDEKERDDLMRSMSPVLNDPMLRLEVQIEDDAHEQISDAIARARRAAAHAHTLKTIGRRFSPQDLNAIDDQTRDRWLIMLLRHAQAFEYEAMRLRGAIESQYSYLPKGPEPALPKVDSENLPAMIDRLAESAGAFEPLATAAFKQAPGADPMTDVQTGKLYRAAWIAERLAEAIRQALSPE